MMRLLASHISGLGHLFCLHLFRLCPSPTDRNSPWLMVSVVWLLLAEFFSMLMGSVVGLVSLSFLARCDLREFNLSMLIVAIVALSAGPCSCLLA